jgi:hypothetical protein
MMVRKARCKRLADGELSSGLWEGVRGSQERLEQQLGSEGAAEARARAEALVSQGWRAAWPEID